MAEKTRRQRRSADPQRAERLRRRAEELREGGLDGVTPLVVHGDEVIGWNDDFEAARIIGLEEMVPRITLEEVFAEAGMDMPQISSPDGEEEGAPEREFFEDYLRSLPEHIRDKYGL
jgi:hypothetical protein